MIPFVPIIQEGEEPFSMFRDLWVKHGDWVLKPTSYPDLPILMEYFQSGIIDKALEIEKKLLARKAMRMEIQDIRDL